MKKKCNELSLLDDVKKFSDAKHWFVNLKNFTLIFSAYNYHFVMHIGFQLITKIPLSSNFTDSHNFVTIFEAFGEFLR